MIRAMLARHLRQHARLLAAACVGLFLFETLLIWVAARIETGAGLRMLIESLLPEEVRSVIFSQFGLASFDGAVAFGFQHPFALVAGIALMVALATICAAERETGFLDLVLARPVPRWRYVAAIVLVLIIAAAILALAQLAGVAAGLGLVGVSEPSWTSYGGSVAVLAALLFVVGGYTLAIAARARRRGNAIAVTAGLTLFFYWIDFLGGFWDALDLPRRISPFYYFDPVAAVGNRPNLLAIALLLAAGAAATGAAFLVFRRQDI